MADEHKLDRDTLIKIIRAIPSNIFLKTQIRNTSFYHTILKNLEFKVIEKSTEKQIENYVRVVIISNWLKLWIKKFLRQELAGSTLLKQK